MILEETIHSSDKEELASIIIKIFETNNTCVSLLQALNENEITATTDSHVIFRGNSLATKAMDQYMKLTGMNYLHTTLSYWINQVFASKHSCEVDPSRLKKKEELNQNWTNLFYFVSNFLDAIFESLKNCPLPLKRVFKILREQVEKKFGSDDIARYTAISGFIFLRLFCPAILAPKLFGMMKEQQDKAKTTRTLTLIAKTLQNLANLVEFGDKEPYMADMNGFIKENISNMKKFIDSLTVVPKDAKQEEKKEIDVSRELAAFHRYVNKIKPTLIEKGGKKIPELTKLIIIAESLDVKVENFKKEVPDS